MGRLRKKTERADKKRAGAVGMNVVRAVQGPSAAKQLSQTCQCLGLRCKNASCIARVKENLKKYPHYSSMSDGRAKALLQNEPRCGAHVAEMHDSPKTLQLCDDCRHCKSEDCTNTLTLGLVREGRKVCNPCRTAQNSARKKKRKKEEAEALFQNSKRSKGSSLSSSKNKSKGSTIQKKAAKEKKERKEREKAASKKRKKGEAEAFFQNPKRSKGSSSSSSKKSNKSKGSKGTKGSKSSKSALQQQQQQHQLPNVGMLIAQGKGTDDPELKMALSLDTPVAEVKEMIEKTVGSVVVLFLVDDDGDFVTVHTEGLSLRDFLPSPIFFFYEKQWGHQNGHELQLDPLQILRQEREGSPQLFEPEAFLNVRFNAKLQKKEFLVKWKGYSDTDNTWEPEENFSTEVRELVNAHYWESSSEEDSMEDE